MSWRFFCGPVPKHQFHGSTPFYEHQASAPWLYAILLQARTITQCFSIFFIMYLFLLFCHKEWGALDGPRTPLPPKHIQQRTSWSGFSERRYAQPSRDLRPPGSRRPGGGGVTIFLETGRRRNGMRICGRMDCNGGNNWTV